MMRFMASSSERWTTSMTWSRTFSILLVHSSWVAPTDISGVVEDVRGGLRAGDLRYREKCAVVSTLEDVPQIAVDANRVRQVIWNLVLNAAQATAETGTIRIALKPWKAGWALEVADEGVGIPIDRIDRIFDPFYTTRSGGTGLGQPPEAS